MHPDLEKLIDLQTFDLELKRVRERMSEVPKRIAGLAARSAAAQATQVQVQEQLAKEEKLRRELESDVKDQQSRAARLRRQMDVVTTTTQAGALEHEISFAEAEVRRMEDLELESMERTETLEAEQRAARVNVADTEAVLERERLRGADEVEKSKAREAELEIERVRLRPSIGEQALGTYDRVSKAKGTGLAEGIEGKCSACQMMMRPQRWQDLRDRSNHELMMTCETCGRLLYWDPARDAPQRKAAEREESVAARIVRSL